MITTNINNSLTGSYEKLFKLADIVINTVIDGVDYEGHDVSEYLTTNPSEIEDDKVYFKVKNTELKNEDNTTDNTLYSITGKTLKAIQELLNPNVRDNYSGLFDVTGEGNENHIRINSLAEYFGVLKILGNIHPRFIRLPLDENYYMINANERTIVPNNKTPRFAVLGDHSAEVIYFKINRYFDTMDLGDAKIIIQSQIGNNKYVTPITLIDLDSEPDYIIFGWPINKLITNISGNLNFAVRFYVYEQGLQYSFGTLTQTLQIKNSLYWFDDMSMNVNGIQPVVDNSGIYLKNFVIQGSTTIAKPVFNDIDCSPRYNNNQDKYYNKDEEVHVKAISNGGDITYTWKYDAKQSQNSSPIDVSSSKIRLYEGKSYCTLDTPGNYSCIATAHVGINEESQAYGFYKVQAPIKYKFNIGSNSKLNCDTFVSPSGSSTTVSLTDYLSANEIYYSPEIDNNGNYINKDYYLPDSQFKEGDITITDCEKPSEDNLYIQKQIRVINTVNGVAAASTDAKTIKMYKPLAATLSLSTTYEDDSNGNRIYSVAVTNNSNDKTVIHGNNTTLFITSYEWKVQDSTTEEGWKRVGEGSTFELPVSWASRASSYKVKVTQTLKDSVGYITTNSISSSEVQLSAFTPPTPSP